MSDSADLPKILGTNLLKNFSPTGQLGVCTIGIFVFYILYGYTQEWIFSDAGFKPFGWYLTFIQFMFYGVLASFEQFISRKMANTAQQASLPTTENEQASNSRKVPYRTYALIAFLTVGTIGCSNTSLAYLNYPTQVIFKCCKLIPVMIGGILIQNKKYKMLDFSAAFLMTIGLIFFTLADVSVSPKFDYRGVALISLALVADAAIGNVQEKTMKTLKASNVEIIFYSYSIGSVYLFLGLLVTNEIWAPFNYAMENLDVYYRILMFSFSGYIGLQFVLALVRIFGAYIAITVTTCRKALSIIISFMFFTKPFTMQYTAFLKFDFRESNIKIGNNYIFLKTTSLDEILFQKRCFHVWSGMIVVSGIALSVYSKNSKGSSINLGDKAHKVIAWFINKQNGANASSDMPNRKKYQELRMENV